MLDADLVITSIGGKPNTWFLKGVSLDKDGGVNADVFLRSTNQPDIFAAGDIVSYPYYYTADRIRVEHLSEAFGHGAYAAWNMLGKMVPYNGVPFFWSRQWNKSIACVGVAKDWDKVVIDGQPEKFEFAAYYFKGGRIVAASGMMRSKDLITLNHAMRVGLNITEDFLNGTTLDIQRVRQALAEKAPRCDCKRAKATEAPCRV